MWLLLYGGSLMGCFPFIGEVLRDCSFIGESYELLLYRGSLTGDASFFRKAYMCNCPLVYKCLNLRHLVNKVPR